MHLSRKTFGKCQDRNVHLYTISNDNGLVVSLTNYGGIVTSVRVPDRQGIFANVVLGYDTLEEYVSDKAYIGGLVGRYANRISKGSFQIDGKMYSLACNDGMNHLHGGSEGFNKKIWEAQPVREPDGCGVALSLISPDGDEGYPGTIDVQVLYLLSSDNALIIDYTAATDIRTIVNLTQHSYFNLAGEGLIHDHTIRINASGYTPVDKDYIPTGSLKSVDGTALDFRKERKIGTVLADADNPELIEGGFDHNFVLDGSGGLSLPAAKLYHPGSGRTLEVYTTEPGLQFYSGNFLNEQMVGRGGVPFCKHGALCLEAQHFPDSPNQRAFPSVILAPGHVYRQTTRYQFGVRI